MKIKYLYISIFLVFTLNATVFVLFLDDEDESNQAQPTQFKTDLVVDKQPNKVNLNDNKIPLVIDSRIEKPLPGIEEHNQQEVVVVGGGIDIDAGITPQTGTEDSEVIEIGEYIDVYAETPQTGTENSEVVEIGEYMDVYTKTPQTGTEDSEVIEIGEYMDVFAEIPQTETEDSEVVEIGEYMDVSADTPQIGTEDSEVVEIGGFIDVDL